MTFKREWETLSEYTTVPEQDIHALVAHALPQKQITSYEIIPGGCANLNIKLSFINKDEPLVLRLYFRDKDATYREQKITELIGKTVPVPRYYTVGDFRQYRYAIIEFIEGVTLRDFLLDCSEKDMQSIMYSAGEMLVRIQLYKFERSGFFDRNLNVTTPFSAEDLLRFIRERLEHPTVIEQLSLSVRDSIAQIIDLNSSCLPPDPSTHLVHADYDPANILVHRIRGVWEIAAIIDWEFAFSGPWLCDVANMMRYAHHMPSVFEQSFLQGIEHAGLMLPAHWRITVDLLNLVSLLDCLVHCPPKQRPRQCRDICGLIINIVQRQKI